MDMARKKTGWRRRLRYRLETGLLRSALWGVPKLSRSMVHRSASVLATVAYWFDRRGRRTSAANLNVVFPGLSPSERRKIALQSYRSLGTGVFELFWAHNLNKENHRKYATIEFEDDEKAAREALNSGCIVITPHYGNFEWMAYVMGLAGHNAVIIAEDFKNPAITPLFTAARSGSGNEFIPQDRAMVRLYRHLRGGGTVALLADLRVSPEAPSTIIRCFELQTSVTVLPAYLARKLNRPILPCLCVPAPGRRYTLKVFEPRQFDETHSIEEISQYCWDVFEPHILENPEHWIWMYKHWRYLPKNPDRPYPEYAKENKHFSG